MMDSTVPLHLRGDFEVGIGSDAGCQVRLPGLEPLHSRLRRMGDRLFIKFLCAGSSTSINRKAIRTNCWIEVTRYDEIVIGGTLLSISPKFFLGRDRVGLDTSPLKYVLPGVAHRILCDGAYLRARPGTFTAILGPAGCGKTLFLSLLNGYLVPNAGRVLIAENFEPHRDHRILRDFIGYVPQDDILIPELTVRQSLNYRLGLKFPDMSSFSKDRLILDTCRLLGLDVERTGRFLDTVIGAPDSHRRGLSGGERKRANLAHELISKPLILILDEPTSGLSSADADQIMQLLKGLAKEELLTVIATIHQPSARAFEQFDDLLVMGFGGKPAYYGPATGAVPFVEDVTDTNCGTLNPAEYILEHVIDPAGGPALFSKFVDCTKSLPYTLSPLAAAPVEPSVMSPAHSSRGQGLSDWLHQWPVLTQRNLAVLFADTANLVLNMLQAPLIAVLILCAFQGVALDTLRSDQFARTIYEFERRIEPFRQSRSTIRADRLIQEAAKTAESDGIHTGPAAAQRRGAIYFALVAAGIWFGTLGACREIVAEKHILRREVRTCTNLWPYLGAKALMQILLTGVQTALLVLVVNLFLLRLDTPHATRLWGVIWLVAVASASLGLLVSCLAPTHRVALTAVPLLMLPQLLFGGMMRPPVEMAPGSTWTQTASTVTIQYWGFRSALETVSPVEKIILKERLRAGSWDQLPYEKFGEFNIVSFDETRLAEAFFPDRESNKGVKPYIPLMLAVVLFLFAGYFVLRLKYL